jgi:energy-coupling factor transport system substrate-specific component
VKQNRISGVVGIKFQKENDMISQDIVNLLLAIAVVGILLGWAYVTKRMQKDFSTMTWVLIPVAIAINIAIGQLVLVLKLPVYLDSIGTVLVGVLCGPWAGALTGALSNTVAGIIFDPSWWPWIPVAAAIGLTAGLCANAGFFKTWWKVAVTGFLIALAATIVGSPISVLLGGISASGSSIITAFLLQTGKGILESVLTTNFIVEPVDKISTSLLAFAIIDGLSARYLARFPRGENAQLDQQKRTGELVIALIAVAVLVVVTILFIVPLLNQ